MDTVTNIWNIFGSRLNKLVCYKIKHQDHCQDIMQDVYIKVTQNIDKISQAENMSAYLVRMTNNAVTDHYRKKQNASADKILEDTAMDNEQYLFDDSLQLADCCLMPMIESLPAIYREALIKTELKGMKQKDYAIEAGISLSNAKVRVQRAKEKLKEVILSCCNYEFDRYGNIVDCSTSLQSASCDKPQ
ncbi:MAG: sigma-70 family RNA polymerase sigma factor [Sphingobacteriales bacterium]|nr:MAG: sigma-70 family RNA polymerase sigma factor [Sphingobacteriales bacterium]